MRMMQFEVVVASRELAMGSKTGDEHHYDRFL